MLPCVILRCISTHADIYTFTHIYACLYISCALCLMCMYGIRTYASFCIHTLLHGSDSFSLTAPLSRRHDGAEEKLHFEANCLTSFQSHAEQQDWTNSYNANSRAPDLQQPPTPQTRFSMRIYIYICAYVCVCLCVSVSKSE